MGKIDFVQLGQSFAVNCEKLKRGGERPNQRVLSQMCAQESHRNQNMAKQGEPGRRSSHFEKHLSFLPGGWGERGILLCQGHALILNCVSWPEEDKCIQSDSSEGSGDAGKERKLPLSGKFPALMSSLGKAVSFCSWWRPQAMKSGVWLCTSWSSQGFLWKEKITNTQNHGWESDVYSS